MYPSNFILSTDYATLKNDTQSNTLSLTISAGTTYNVSSPLLAQTSVEVGTINAGIRARGKTTKYTPWLVGPSLLSTMMVSIPSLPAVPPFEQWLICNLERTSASTIRLTASSEGGSGSPDFKIEDSQTITFVFSTFLSPFD